MRLAFMVSMALVLASPQALAQKGAKSSAALLKEGERLFNARKYRESAEVLKRAYDAQPDPRLLYNIARAYEQAGDLREALSYYDQFIKNSDSDMDPLLLKRAHSAAERARVLIEKEEQATAAAETERKRLKEEAEASRKKAEEEQAAAQKAQELARQQQQAEYERSLDAYRRSKVTAFALGGASVASLGVGVLFGLQARNSRDDFDKATSLEVKKQAADDTRSKALLADIGFGVGLAAAIGAIIVYPKEGPPVEGEVRMTLAPSGLGAGMEVSF
jgi:tetratricopeptide (TPR) repeat protein